MRMDQRAIKLRELQYVLSAYYVKVQHLCERCASTCETLSSKYYGQTWEDTEEHVFQVVDLLSAMGTVHGRCRELYSELKDEHHLLAMREMAG